MALTIYREVPTVIVTVAEAKNLSVGRLRGYLQAQYPDWEKRLALAGFIYNDPTHYEPRWALHEQRLRGVVAHLGIDIPTLLERAEAYWIRRDEEIAARLEQKRA